MSEIIPEPTPENADLIGVLDINEGTPASTCSALLKEIHRIKDVFDLPEIEDRQTAADANEKDWWDGYNNALQDITNIIERELNPQGSLARYNSDQLSKAILARCKRRAKEKDAKRKC